MAVYEIKELGLKFRPIPYNRVVKCSGYIFTPGYRHLWRGSLGQFYISKPNVKPARFGSTYIEPGSWAKDLAAGVTQLGDLTIEAFTDFADMCDRKTGQRKVRRAIAEIENGFETLGFDMPKGIAERLKKAA